jgi:hypothetical protein
LLPRVPQRLIRPLFLQEIWSTSTSWHRKCFIRVLQLHLSCFIRVVLYIICFLFRRDDEEPPKDATVAPSTSPGTADERCS